MSKIKTIDKYIFIFVVTTLGCLMLYDAIFGSKANTKIFNSKFVGTEFPSFNVVDIDSNEVFSEQTLLEATANIRIVNFFASWCKYCKQEHDLLLAIAKAKELDAVVYGFALNDNIVDLRTYLTSGNPYKYTALVSEESFNPKLKISGIPVSFILDKNNKIIAHFQGMITVENFNYFLSQYNKKTGVR